MPILAPHAPVLSQDGGVCLLSECGYPYSAGVHRQGVRTSRVVLTFEHDRNIDENTLIAALLEQLSTVPNIFVTSEPVVIP